MWIIRLCAEHVSKNIETHDPKFTSFQLFVILQNIDEPGILVFTVSSFQLIGLRLSEFACIIYEFDGLSDSIHFQNIDLIYYIQYFKSLFLILN